MEQELLQPAHLLAEAASALTLSIEERVRFCNSDRWIGYPQAQRILEVLEDAICQPRDRVRMRSVLIVGIPNNGKTSVLEKFMSRHRPGVDSEGRCTPHPLYVLMPTQPTLSRFWTEVLDAMRIVHSPRDTVTEKARQAREVMVYTRINALVIDEVNHVGQSGKEAIHILGEIKNLTSALRIPVIAAGIPTAENAIQLDDQMSKRFRMARLDPWKLDMDYLRLLASYERLLPLPKPSDLAGASLRSRIYAMAGPAIGDTVELLQLASQHAIRSGCGCIDARVLDAMDYQRSGSRWARQGADH